jgi:hypothetical protein
VYSKPLIDFDSPKAVTKANPYEIDVKFIGNTAMYFDTQCEVILTGAYKWGALPLHIKDHEDRYANSKVGDMQKAYVQDINYKGVSLQSLIFESKVVKDYDQNIFTQYSRGVAMSHSIGAQRVLAGLAVKDGNDGQKKLWKKYIDQIFNKDEVLKYGFFVATSEIFVNECSIVLRPANEISMQIDFEASDISVSKNDDIVVSTDWI